MPNKETVESEQSLVATSHPRTVEIPAALPVRLQTLDLARHIAIAPDGKRYIVATFDDTRLGRDYVTAIYPQQGGYLTLIRLVISEISSGTQEQAMQLHLAQIHMVQQGKLSEFIKSHRR